MEGWNLAGKVDLPEADLWWMSPPCQPTTVRGAGRDDEDPRSRPLIRLCAAIAARRPRFLALENVPGFVGSRSHARVREALAGYTVRERLACPSELGLPLRRRRFYLLAGREGLPEEAPLPALHRPFAPDPDPDPDLYIPADYPHFRGLDIAEPGGTLACFSSAYARSPVRAGSVLRTPDGRLRRLSPEEISRIHGYPPLDFAGMSRERATELVGNGLSVDVVRWLLAPLLAG